MSTVHRILGSCVLDLKYNRDCRYRPPSTEIANEDDDQSTKAAETPLGVMRPQRSITLLWPLTRDLSAFDMSQSKIRKYLPPPTYKGVHDAFPHIHSPFRSFSNMAAATIPDEVDIIIVGGKLPC